ncbi:MAG: peptidylprolyl isomerase [Candidatus Aenigmarchaeota archaeon]|nr:peptidylprolyl isomerase [Candidatus Aenigmarchaeota archaeon]
MTIVQKGDFVRINYIGRLESGDIFDLTYEDVAKKEKIFNSKFLYRPVPIIVGENFILPKLEELIIGMEIGKKAHFRISPDDGFGKRRPDMVRVFPKRVFREKNIQPGMIVDVDGTRGRIQSINAGRVRIDFNNPLAGKILEYDVDVVEKITSPENQIKAVFEFFGIEVNVKIENKEAVIETSIILPPELKQRISDVIIKNVSEIERIKYIEIFGKK